MRHLARRYVAAQLLLAVTLALSSSWPGTPGQRALADAALQSVAAGLAAAVILARSGAVPLTRRTWRWAGAAAAFWAGGQVWLTGQLALTGTLSRPSPADLLFVLAVGCAVAGALSFPSLPQDRRRRWRLTIDGSVLAGSVAFLVLARVDGVVTTSSNSLLALAYPLADCLVITVLLIATMRAPRRLVPSLGTAVLGLVVLSVTNLEAFRLGLAGQPVLSHPVNAGFVIGLGLVGVGALLQRPGALDQAPDRPTDLPIERVQRLLPYLFLPVVILRLLLSEQAPSGLPLALLVGLAALLLLRQVLVVEENATLAADVVRRAHRYQALVQGSSELVLVVDHQGVVSYASPSVSESLALPTDRAEGWNLLDVTHEDDRFLFRAAVADTRSTGRATCRLRVQGRQRQLVVEARFADRTADAAVHGLVVNARDVTDEAAAQASLADSERRYRRIVETATEGIWVNDADGVTRFVNAHAAEMLGLPVESIVGRRALDVLAEVVPPETLVLMAERMQQRRQGITSSYDFTLRRPDGRVVHAHVSASPLLDAEGRFDGSLSMITDMTARVEAEEQLRRDARTDSLTGLPNRAMLAASTATALTHQQRERPPAVIYCDLDGFKAINDAWGHSAGDELLRKVAQRLLAFDAEDRTVSRLGGDEFAILFHAAEEGAVEATAEEVMRRLRAPYVLGGREHHIDLSIGIAVAAPGDDVESLLRNADLAMYQAKNDGRGRLRRYERAMHATASARLRLEQDLRHAMARDELLVHYQPVVSLTTGQCVGAEALIRWEHPALGMVSPDRFIPIAEGSELILRIGEWVLERSMHDAERWEGLGRRLVLSVNVAPQQLMDHQHVQDLLRLLRHSRLPADQVILEVTERSLLAGERPRDALRALRGTGARLALDDFGTGYSSIAHLRDHPVDVLKLDRSYVTQVTGRSSNRSLATAIVNMSKELGISCTAEGIETREQATVLAAAGCAHAQGYLYAPPMAHDQLMAWIAARGTPLPEPRRAERDVIRGLG